MEREYPEIKRFVQITKNKIQTFFIKNLVKPTGFMKRFGFYKGLDKAN